MDIFAWKEAHWNQALKAPAIALDVNVDPLGAECLGRPLRIQSIDVPAIAILVRDPDPPERVITPSDSDVLASGRRIVLRDCEANSTEVGIPNLEAISTFLHCEICRGIEDKRSASALNFTAEGETTYPSWFCP